MSDRGVIMSTGKQNRNFLVFVLIMVVTIALSAYKPHHQILWFAHSLFVLIGLIILIITRKKFPFTPLAYTLMWLYGSMMMIGAHYTYAHEPFFDYIQEAFALSRNHSDRFVHFFQGFTPAIIIREILLRKRILNNRRWLFFITVSICLSISAFYELMEWWFALLSGKRTSISLQMQGDFWDTQWDIFLAMIGASTSMLLLANRHDRQIERLKDNSAIHESV